MTAYRFDIANNAVEPFATKKQATSKGNDVPVFDSLEAMIENEEITTPAMLALYNKLTNEKVARFSDRAKGAKRLFKVLSALTPLATEVAEGQVEVAKTAKETAKAERKAAKEARKAAGVGAGRKKGSGKRAGKTVYALTSVNPRLAGSHGFNSFEIIKGKKEGVLYETYRELGGRDNDLDWDEKHGFAETK